MLQLQPIDFDEAREFILRHHRHHLPPQGWKFGIAVSNVRTGEIVGVATVGRPVARALDDGWTLEVTRLCTTGGPEARNAASMLYAASWRAARAMGYRRLITYTLKSEAGTSLRAAGWRVVHQTRAHSWSTPSRARIDKHPTGQKTLWEVGT